MYIPAAMIPKNPKKPDVHPAFLRRTAVSYPFSDKRGEALPPPQRV